MAYLVLLVSLALAASLPGIEPHEASVETMELREALVLGADSRRADTMFGDPSWVGTDGAGNLYIADQLSLRIKVFDRRGRFVRALGGRGRGEGRFLSLAGVSVTSDGTVLGIDQMGGRFTWFSPRGDVQTVPLDPQTVTWPRSITSSPQGYFLLYRREGTGAIIHQFSTDLGRPLRSFGSAEVVIGRRDSFLDDFSFVAPGALAWWGSRLAVAPAVCDGRVTTFTVEPEDSAPRILHGVRPRRSLERVETPTNAPDVTVVSGPEGPRAARLFCRSAGLVALAGGRLAHFSVRRQESGEVLFVEVFDAEGRLTSSSIIDEVRISSTPTPYLPVQVFDGGSGRIAVIDRTGDVPLVRVYEVATV